MPQTLRLPDLDALDPAALKALLLEHHERYTARLSFLRGEHSLGLTVEQLTMPLSLEWEAQRATLNWNEV